MFNLENSIIEWRRQMIAAGVKDTNVLDELESHLREDVESRMAAGAGAEQAFEAAVQQIGRARALQHEFAKVGGRKWALLMKLRGIFVERIIPLPSPGKFGASARQTLELARTEAPRLHHNFIGTEHALLGLLSLESGVVPNVLKRMNVDREDLRKRVEMWISIFPSRKMKANLPFTPRLKKALHLAALEAKAGNHACIGSEHIFLGLLLEGDGVAARVLQSLGLNIQTAREEIQRELGGK
jgi:hypothetical protein